MCRPVQRQVCGKTTRAGCGQHIAGVKRPVPPRAWRDGTHTQAEIDAVTKPGLFARLFGR